MPSCKLVYVIGPGGRRVGMAFVVDQSHLLTCAHVVVAALGLPEACKFDNDKPAGQIDLDFFEAGTKDAKGRGDITAWYRCVDPGAGGPAAEVTDIALLRIVDGTSKTLKELGAQLRPMTLAPGEKLRTELTFSVYGIPKGGVAARGRLDVMVGASWLAIIDAGAMIEGGFSGGAAVTEEDEETSIVCGMITRGHGNENQTLLTPSSILQGILREHGVQNTPLPRQQTTESRSTLPPGLRLAKEELYALLDRIPIMEDIQHALYGRAPDAPMPVFLIDCDPDVEVIDGLVMRIGVEVALDFRAEQRLVWLTTDMPAGGSIDDVVRRYTNNIARTVGDKSGSALALAVRGYNAVHLHDVELDTSAKRDQLARLLGEWAKAVKVARAEGPRKAAPPFFVLVTTAAEQKTADREVFRLALSGSPDLELYLFHTLGLVEAKQLRQWARSVSPHLDRKVREPDQFARKVREIVYGEQTELSMAAWYEKFGEQQEKIFG